MNENLLEVQNLSVVYKTQFETVQAVNNVSFSLRRGQTMGLVGETGAGKTTTSLAIMRLLPDRTGRVESGKVMFEGRDLLELTNQEMCSLRGEKIAIVGRNGVGKSTFLKALLGRLKPEAGSIRWGRNVKVS